MGFALTKPKGYLAQGDYFCWIPDASHDFSLGGPAVHRKLCYMRIDVAKLPKVTVVREKPEIGAERRGWGGGGVGSTGEGDGTLTGEKQEKGKKKQEIKSRLHSDF